MTKINIIKFSPYFPPHKWWLESHIEQWSYHYVKRWYWKVYNITSDIWQKKVEFDVIFDKKWNNLWYKRDWYEVLLLPCFDLIYWFPFPKFWKKSFWNIIWYLKSKKNEGKKDDRFIVNTHTRFFLTSLLGLIYSIFTWIKCIHIEHWVDYVKLNSEFKTALAYIYDNIIGRFIFVFSDKVLAISEWCKTFSNKFTSKEIDVIHRWIEFSPSIIEESIKHNKIISFQKWKIIIWFIWRLVKLKGVDLLLKSLKKLDNDFELWIVWDWDEIDNLKKLTHTIWLVKKVKFLWFQEHKSIYSEILPKIHILVNSSYQEWLPTSVIEGLISCCVVVATDVGGTKEISTQKDLVLIKSWSQVALTSWIKVAIKNYVNLVWLSKDLVLNRFNWDSSIEKYNNYFKNI